MPPTPPPADQTVGYDPLNTSELATAPTSGDGAPSTNAPDATLAAGSIIPATPSGLGLSGLSSLSGKPKTGSGVYRSRGSFGKPGQTIVSPSGMPIPVEALIGPYEIQDELGKGGMGVVYRARHVHLNRVAALKMILAGARTGPEHFERFRTEAEAVASLDHPNIVRVYDVGEHNGNPYIALELIEGGSLAKKANGKPMPAREAATFVESIAQAVHAAHEKGIVHRDLKPANVLLTLDGQPKVTDFGLAKNLDHAGSGHTNAGSILGTPSYMAPEQAAGRVLDIGPGTDVYALGAVLYELLVGHPPFRGESAIATIRMVLDGEVIAPRSLVASIPKDLDTICLKALQKPIHRRYESAAAMAEDLRRFLDDVPITARPITRTERFVKWVRRKPTAAATIATGIVAAIAMLALGLWSYSAVTRRAAEAELAHKQAESALAESTRRMIRLNVANGTRLIDDGDYLGSIIWYAEALRLDSDDDERARMHRIRLRSVMMQCPVPVQMWRHDGAISDARFDGTGKRVITASDDGVARVWDAVGGQSVGQPMEHGSPVKFAVLSNDGSTAVTVGADGSLRFWDATQGLLRFKAAHGDQPTGVAVNDAGTLALTAGVAGRVRLWDLRTGKEAIPALEGTHKITAIRFSRDGTRFVIGTAGGTAQVFLAATGAALSPPIRHGGTVTSCAFHPNGKRIVTGCGDGTVNIWDATTGLAVWTLPARHVGQVLAVAFSPDGLRVASASHDHTAQVWEAETGRPIGRPVLHQSGVTMLEFSPDGRWFATGSEDNSARVWDTLTGEPISPPFRNNASPVAVTFNPNGYQLLVATPNRIVKVWDLLASVPRNLPSAAPPEVPVGTVRTVASADGSFSATFGNGPTVRIRRTSDHEPVGEPLRLSSGIRCVAFSGTADRIAAGDDDGNVMVWTTSDGKPLWNQPGRHASRVHRVLFSPDGQTLASSSDDNTAGLWNAANGQALVPPIRLGGSVTRLEFNPSGRILSTFFPDGKARMWDTTSGEPLTPRVIAGTDWAETLIPINYEIDDLLKAGRMLSGQTLNDQGSLVPTDSAATRNDWQQLKEKHPMVFDMPVTQVVTWRTLQVKLAEESGLWYAAAWHLDRLIERSDDGDLRRQRAQAAAKLGDWERAERDADRAVRLLPVRAEAWYLRGQARGQLGRWPEAAADFAKATELANDATVRPGLAALVAAEAGDQAGYRKACIDEFNLYRNDSEVSELSRMVWACTIKPDSGIPATELLVAAEKVFAGHADRVAGAAVLAAAQLRAGKLDDAAKTLEPLLNRSDDRPVAWALFALVQKKRGKTADVAAWREKAQAWLNRPPATAPARWDQRAGMTILLAEIDQ